MFARLIRAAALLLIAGQAIVAQAHQHAPARAAELVAAAAADADARSAPEPQRPDTPVDCPVCREIAHGGPYHVPTKAKVEPPMAADRWSSQPPAFATLHPRSSHAWRSRAPPVLLPA